MGHRFSPLMGPTPLMGPDFSHSTNSRAQSDQHARRACIARQLQRGSLLATGVLPPLPSQASAAGAGGGQKLVGWLPGLLSWLAAFLEDEARWLGEVLPKQVCMARAARWQPRLSRSLCIYRCFFRPGHSPSPSPVLFAPLLVGTEEPRGFGKRHCSVVEKEDGHAG